METLNSDTACANSALSRRHLPRLQIHSSGRFFEWENGDPFFYLADTGWTILERLTREEIAFYLQNRAQKGFNVVQVMGISEFGGLSRPNREGHLPLHNQNPETPNEAYWELCDFAVETAARLGIVLAILPTWGDAWYLRRGLGPQVLTPENARVYGRFLGARYAQKTVIWLLGGDREFLTETHRETTRQLARGLREGDGGRNLISVHPAHHESSSLHFHAEEWLDFSMWQSGHQRKNELVAKFIGADYGRTPAKPVLDGEPCYEEHPSHHEPPLPCGEKAYFDDYDVRKAVYRAVFAGAAGAAYGANGVFQNHLETIPNGFGARREWRAALELPGAAQMGILRALMESLPPFSSRPRPELIEDNTRGALGAEGGNWALIHLPNGGQVEVKTALLQPNRRASWFCPRTGDVTKIPTSPDGVFAAPDARDWVLQLLPTP